MPTITVRVPDKLNLIIGKFCKAEDRSKSWLVKKALMEKLEEWQDMRDIEKQASLTKRKKK